MEDLTKRKIGQRINEALACSDTKQKDLAKYLGVTDNTVSYFVSGRRAPNIEQIIKISELLNVSTDFLLGKSTPKTPIDTEEGKLVRSICDYTGLNEDSVKFLAESKETNLSKVYIDFLNFFIKNMSEEVEISMDDMREMSTAKSLMNDELFNTVNDMAGDISVGEMFSRWERDSETFLMVDEVFELKNQIDDLETLIDGLKFKISKFFNKLIDDFAVSNISADRDFDSLSAFDVIYGKDIYTNLLELKKYAKKLTEKDKGDANNGNYKKEE